MRIALPLKDPIRTQNAKKVLIKDQVLKIRTLIETVHVATLGKMS